MDAQATPILIVDDEVEMTRLARRLLQRLGFRNVDEANDGVSAMNLLRQRHHRLALVDLNMRPVPGPELIKAIKSDRNLEKPSIIIMSGSNTPDSIATVRQLGVNGYLLKPFTMNTLKLNLARIFGTA